jgi:hypothetical protein
MPRQLLPVLVPDLPGFARALGRALHARHASQAAPPGHSALLQFMAHALGHRNYQSLRAAAAGAAAASGSTAAAPPEAATALSANARKTLAQFDDAGRLLRWPVKYTVQRLAMWVLWTRFEAKRIYTEREVNAILRAANAFGDHVTLRRELVNHGLLARKSDCSEYRKLAARPDDETRALLTAARARFRGD